MTTWGYMLKGPGRPPIPKQRDILRALGVDVDAEHGPVMQDEVERCKPGPGGAREQLESRGDLLKIVRQDDRVVVAAPYCLGVSRDDAAWFLGALAQAGAVLIVSNDAWLVAPGAKADRLLDEVARQQNATNVAEHRRRRSS